MLALGHIFEYLKHFGFVMSELNIVFSAMYNM